MTIGGLIDWQIGRLRNRASHTAILSILVLYCVAAGAQQPGRSKWVYPAADGSLQYAIDARGNRIMDFSHAGYNGGGVRIPDVRVVRTVKSIAGDNTPNIQSAIDEVAARPVDADGFRGAVLLERGTYEVAATLRIAASGVVLRGSGSGADSTVLRVTGEPHRVFAVGGSGTWQIDAARATVTDTYVPAGAHTVSVDAAGTFRPGDAVVIQRAATEGWIHFMNMDTLTRDGKPQTWLKPGTIITHDRTIAAVEGNRLTFDVPLSDSFDAAYVGTTIAKYTFPDRISQVGLESLRVMVPAQDKPISEAQYTLLSMNAVADGWIRDIVSVDTQNSTTFGSTVRRVTIDRVHIQHTVPFTAAAAPADFAISGTQILLDRSSVTGEGVWPVVTQVGVTGPNVILNFKSTTAGIAPHQRWATGLLVDSSEFTGGSDRRPNIAFSNREYAGSGHGWSVGWAVAWNVKAEVLLIQQPPGSKNWCIGCTGRFTPILWHGNPIPIPESPSETHESPNVPVTPASLYLAQLRDRLGEQALRNVGR